MEHEIVILDAQLANPGDLSWSSLQEHAKLKIYPFTSTSEIIERSKEASILITNKIKLDKSHFSQLPKLKLVCLLATGYDNINITDASSAGITVCNAVGYGVDSVAQHVFALILKCTNLITQHNQSIQNGAWQSKQWSYTLDQIRGLSGKCLGIYGYGKIGRKVAQIGRAFGMRIIAHHKHPERDAEEGVEYVKLEDLCSSCDILSLHAPLSSENEGIIDRDKLQLMKTSAILINTARGGLINEIELSNFLKRTPSFMAALDVLSQEPPPSNHPLIGLQNCILTPHNAWSNIDARKRLIEIVTENVAAFINNEPINIVEILPQA